MKRTLVWEKSFFRALKKISKKNSSLEEKIYTTLERLTENPFHQQLDTHKLYGTFQGLWAYSVEYDCRILFSFEKRKSEDYIVLVDIGTHDEVY